MSIATPDREPTPDEVDRVLIEIERCLMFDQAPPVPAPSPLPAPHVAEVEADVIEPVTHQVDAADNTDDTDEIDADEADEIVDGELVPVDLEGGETDRVQRLRMEVAEAHQLVRLQADEAPLLVDTDKVRKRRRAVVEAARLHELAQDPAALAYRDAKVRRTTTVMVMAAAGIGLAVSSIGVQASVAKAMELEQGSFGWWAAFGVEPALSLPLLAAVSAQAYSAMRGQVVNRKDAAGKKLFRAEALLLGLTLALNCWPAFTGDFDLLTLIVHSLGPIAAVTAVWVLPALWSVLSVLPVPSAAGTGGTGPSYRANTRGQYTAEYTQAKIDIAELIKRARAMVAAGQLPADAGIHKIRKALGCGVDYAREVQKALTGTAGGAA